MCNSESMNAIQGRNICAFLILRINFTNKIWRKPKTDWCRHFLCGHFFSYLANEFYIKQKNRIWRNNTRTCNIQNKLKKLKILLLLNLITYIQNIRIKLLLHVQGKFTHEEIVFYKRWLLTSFASSPSHAVCKFWRKL